VARKAGGAGPRQPLSQRRPKVARGKGASSSRPPKKGPPTSKVQPSAGKPRITVTPKGAKPRGAARKRIAPANLRQHASDVFEQLFALYPDAHCELDYQNAYQLLVATILSAQCTDQRVNMVTPTLFTRYANPAALAAARQEDVEEIIRSTGFFRNKARNLIGMAGGVMDRHGGNIPASMDDLVQLPGVGRKTANVVLGNACGINEGVVVDTHVQRLANRLGLTSESDPVKIEQDLMKLYDRDRWTLLSHLLIWHGRRVCYARKPRCADCTINTICPSAFRV
jgi:endonuclease-3